MYLFLFRDFENFPSNNLKEDKVDDSFIGSSLQPDEAAIASRLVINAIVVGPVHGTLKFNGTS
jgi:hypothetical protein